jgi:hypothetical protein
VHFEGTFAAVGFSLRVRLDGHTSRSLVLAKRGQTEIPLEVLSNEWTKVTPGVHEVVVFATDQRGVVPQNADGRLALDRCRFEIDANGAITLTKDEPAGPLLLSPEGTLHGLASDVPLLQVAGGSPREVVELRIERPDGGTEVHELELTQANPAESPHALFDVTGLQNGDYTFVASTASAYGYAKPRGGVRTSGHAHRVNVNRERVGVE